MPLKLWLPLDGTNENRGISGVTMSGSPASWGNGRTGKCAVFNNNTGNCIANSTTEFNYTVEDFSWAIWAKKDYSSITSTSMWIFTVGRADAGGRGYGLRAASTTQVQVWFGTSTWNINCPDNEWHHFAFTRKGTAIKIYRDGALITSATFGGTLPTYSDGSGPGIGCFHYNNYSGNNYPLIGAISDFRIYNHTLSAKEVYELSRALILHYPLSAPGNANPNLITWSRNYTKATPYVHSSAATDGHRWMSDSLVTVIPGKTYYIQLKCDHTPRPNHGNSVAVSDSFTFWFYMRIIGTTKSIGGFDRAICFTSSNIFINDPSRNLYVWQWSAPSNAQDVTFRTNTYSDGSTVVTMKFWDFKMEEGAYTSYIPSKNAAQYGELGYGSGIVRDASGRGNDGKWSAVAPTPVVGSPRYAMATQFNNTESGSSFITYQLSAQLPKVSLAYWLYIPSGHTSYMSIETDNASPIGSLWISANTEGNGLWSYWGGKYHRALGALETDTWHHIVFTFDQGTTKWYRNGVQAGSASTAFSSHTTWPSTVRTIGDSYTGSSWNGTKFTGRLSDYRIYGTVLSADDVKYLYETSAAIDNNGDMFADSFEETEMIPRVGKEGLVYGSHLSESGGTVCAYTSASKGNVDPNMSSWSYTPAADANNSCMTGFYFECIPGVQKYRIELLVKWSGFADISTTHTNFQAYFQGITYNASGTKLWVDYGPMNAAMNSSKSLTSLATGAASGTYKYSVEFTLPNTWPDTYKGNDVGIRTDYSNGTGTWTISKVRIYPADEHMEDTASLCSSGAIQVRLADEAGLA